jgi:D-3-phosphoglycerate dehydrogenase
MSRRVLVLTGVDRFTVEERERSDDALIGLANVVLTPHAAFYSEESLVEMKQKVSRRVLAVLAGADK